MLRTFRRGDPEPDDHPDLADDLGHLWIYDDLGDDEQGIWPGWHNPLTDDGPCSWEDMFRAHGAEALYELSEVEARRLEHELFGWHTEYPQGS